MKKDKSLVTAATSKITGKLGTALVNTSVCMNVNNSVRW